MGLATVLCGDGENLPHITATIVTDISALSHKVQLLGYSVFEIFGGHNSFLWGH